MPVLPALLAALLALAAAAAPATEIVRLRDGTLVHGHIVEFDEPTGFVLEKVTDGGRLPLRWEHLPPAEVRRIKASRGFTGEGPEPWLVDVVHLLLSNGTTETGVPVDRDDRQAWWLHRRGSTDAIPRRHVVQVETGRVPGLSVYTPDELYAVIVDARGVPQDASGHFALALQCEGAGLWSAAAEHYDAAAQLDPGHRPELLAVRRRRVAIKLEDAVETAALDEIRQRLVRGQFEQAAQGVEAFRGRFPESRQLGELAQLETEIVTRRRQHLGQRVVPDYHALLDKRLQLMARDASVTLDVAEQVLTGPLHADLLATLGERYDLLPESVDELWDGRRGGSMRSSSYGTGTFILGRERALRFGRFEEEAAAGGVAATAGVEAGDDFAALVEKVKRQRAEREAERASRRRGGDALSDEGPTPDGWWRAAATDERLAWMTAYYAEFSGELRVVEARGRECRHCEGSGAVEGLNERGEVERRTCGVCKGLKAERLVRYR